MLRSLGADEWPYWVAYSRLEPWGEERADLRAAIVAATVANCNPYRKKGARPLRPGDFMPDFGAAAEVSETRAAETPQQQAARFRGTMAAVGALFAGAGRRAPT